MKTYGERCEGVSNKIQKLKKQRRLRWGIAATACMLLVTTLSLVLFVPFSTNPPDVSQYSDSPYYSLIQKINEATYVKPAYKNNFQLLCSQFEKFAPGDLMEGMSGGSAPDANGSAATGTNGSYVEVTDNQVAGVTEADIIKRTDKYIFFIDNANKELNVYNINGENTKRVLRYKLNNDQSFLFTGKVEMFLSENGDIITLIGECVSTQDADGNGYKGSYVCVRSLEFNGENKEISENFSVYISGNIMSSRLADGKLLVMSKYWVVNNAISFDDENTFLPQIGRESNMESIAAENILAPEVLTNTRYTVVTALDVNTLEILDTAAFLSYSEELYISRENIFATRSYREKSDDQKGEYLSRNMTEISCIAYGDGNLEYKGSVKVPGSVKDRYSMDEFEGILRVVTSVQETVSTTVGETTGAMVVRNASLYCVSLKDFRIVASVEKFAPDNEQAESVRFDGNTAYVCTAEVITLTDPVYYFDLSDLNNITWKDTGTIDGYSDFLINLGNGFLVGIGYDADNNPKVEIYEETDDAVRSVCAHSVYSSIRFSENYKSYFIDRERGIIGVSFRGWEGKPDDVRGYLLYHFDGSELKLLLHDNADFEMRGIVIDDYFYKFSIGFSVMKIW